MALILRNGGSQSPDRWLREPRNNHFGIKKSIVIFAKAVFTCNLHTAILSSSFFLYLEHSHHSLRYYYISSKHRMTDAMYIILHTGCLYFDTRKKKQRRKILLSCTAFHHLLCMKFVHKIKGTW